MSSERIIYFDEKGEPSSTQLKQRSLPRLLEDIRDHAVDQLKNLFKEMLDGADDALFDLADKARSNKDQSLYFDSMRELRIKRKGMENIFGQQLLNKFQELQKNTVEVDDVVIDELPLDGFALVQEDELEENLAIDSMVEKARKANRVAIEQVETRLDTILPNVRIEHSNNPVDPRNICEAFREASHTLELDIKAKLIVYKLFERMVTVELDQVYDEINNFLINNGILPELHQSEAEKQKQSRQKRRQKSPASTARQTQDEDLENYDPFEDNYSEGAGSGGDSVGVEVLGALRELLAVQKAPPGFASNAIPQSGNFATGGNVQQPANPVAGSVSLAPAPVVDNQQLVHALSAVQNNLSNLATSTSTVVPVADLRGQIGTVLPIEGPVSGNSIGQANDDVIDIISMLFDFILDDKNLPDEFKALIGRLQIPMLKVAILDETFFSKGNHPARKLLNEMARAGIGWSKEDAGSMGLRAKVEEIVTYIIDEFDDDPSIFQGLLDDFHDFLVEQKKRAEIVEKRTREAEEGKAKAETARYKVELALKDLVGERIMPDAVNRLLFEAWESVMLLDFLKSGEGSESWEKNLETAQKLVDTLEPPKNAEQRKSLTGKLSNLVKNIKAGLDAVAYGEFESAQLFQELEQIHLKVLKGEAVIRLPQQQQDTDDSEMVQDSEQAQDQAVLDELLQQELSSQEKVASEDEKLAQELAEVEVENVDEIFDESIDDIEDIEEIEFSEDDLEKLAALELAQKTGSVETSEEIENPEEPVDVYQQDQPESSENFAEQDVEEIDMSIPAGFTDVESSNQGGLPDDDEYVLKVGALHVGNWFEVKEMDKTIRAKLAAIIPSVGKFIFVNRTGVKVAEYTKNGLALAMKRDEVVQLNDGALFDRALESIVSNLRNLKKTQDEGI